jgi:hypothetical protein
MKMSEWLREVQSTGKIPETSDPWLAFWAGWLSGVGARRDVVFSKESIATAIQAAEFIEAQK